MTAPRRSTAPATLEALLVQVRACTACASTLPCGPRPVLQAHSTAKILIAGQAPGRKVHESGIPFDDASGHRLREWMGITRAEFYDEQLVAILPMAFCYPGTGSSGDLPPAAACAPLWRTSLLAHVRRVELTLVIGQYAQAWHLGSGAEGGVTQTVKSWRAQLPMLMALPHPSPRNNRWLKKNDWFERDALPALQRRVRDVICADSSVDLRGKVAEGRKHSRGAGHSIQDGDSTDASS